MDNTIIRYASVGYGGNLLFDHFQSGLGRQYLELSSVGRQEINNAKNILKMLHIKSIYYAPSVCCQQTAQLMSEFLEAEIFCMSELRNIPHNLESILGMKIDSTTQITDGMLVRMRRNFLKSFLNDTLDESKAKIIKRIQFVANNYRKRDSCLLVSHGLFMKLLDIHLTAERISSEKEIIGLGGIYRPFYGPLIGYSLISQQKVTLSGS